jgi:Ras GTPase-activating protein 1
MDSMTLRHPLGCKVMPEQRYDVDGELYSDVQVLTDAAKGLRDGGPPPVPAKPMPIYERVDTLVTGASKHKAGFIVKKAKRSKKWKAMFFVLLPDKRRLEYFDDESSFKPKGLVDLEAATIYPLDSSYFGRPNCFQIIVQSSEIFLCCNSEAEAHEWMAALSEFCGNCGYGRLTSDVSVRSNLKSLNLTIVEAKKFGTKFSMPYCIVNLNQVKLARTPVIQSKSSNPFWNEEFSFDNLSDSVTSVTVVLCNRSRGIKDKQIASLTIPFSDLQKTPELDTWSDLVSDGSKTGSMRIKVGFVNGVLLPLADYAPLTRLLIAPGVAVPLLMAATLKGQMNALSKNLLQVWIATGKVTTYLSTVVQLDVAAETKVATLFRGNSLGTKCMDQFMKIVAMPFLHEAIASPVKKVFEDKRSCELDPTRKGSDANLGVLIEHVIAVMNGIKAAAANCPPELKAALETVRTSTITRFPDEAMVQYTSVSAFIFLRLICPAILNPKLFNMMPDLPSASTQRNLTLVAKVVQNMANMAEFGAKEPFMEVCNAHIQQQQAYTQRLLINLSTAGPQVRSKVEPNDAGVSQRAHMNIIRQCQKHLADLKKVGTEDAKSLVATLSRF